MRTRDYMAAAKKALGGISDYALAKELDLTRSGVSQLVNGQIVMGTTTAAKIAEILELDPMQVIADAELERGSSPDLWKRIAKSVAAGLVAAIGAGLAAPTADAAVRGIACVLCKIPRRLLLPLMPPLGDDDDERPA